MTPYQTFLSLICSVLLLSGIAVLGAGGYLYQESNATLDADFDVFKYNSERNSAYICFGVGGASVLASIVAVIVLLRSLKE